MDEFLMAVPDVVAIIQAYNEELILEATLTHLAHEGVGVYLMDHGSTDDTPAIARAFVGRCIIGIERFPPTDHAANTFNLGQTLQRKAELACILARRGAHWIMHHDADELRESPWPGVDLRAGLQRVQAEGYNAVDHAHVGFSPTAESYQRGMPLEHHFRHYDVATAAQRGRQVKTWLQGPELVDLATHAGHLVQMPGLRVYPVRFVMRHYPILSSDHGRRKVFRERKPRYAPDALAKGWHRHYNTIQHPDHNFLRRLDDPALRLYDDHAFKQSLLAEAAAATAVPRPLLPRLLTRILGRK